MMRHDAMKRASRCAWRSSAFATSRGSRRWRAAGQSESFRFASLGFVWRSTHEPLRSNFS